MINMNACLLKMLRGTMRELILILRCVVPRCPATAIFHYEKLDPRTNLNLARGRGRAAGQGLGPGRGQDRAGPGLAPGPGPGLGPGPGPGDTHHLSDLFVYFSFMHVCFISIIYVRIY